MKKSINSDWLSLNPGSLSRISAHLHPWLVGNKTLLNKKEKLQVNKSKLACLMSTEKMLKAP